MNNVKESDALRECRESYIADRARERAHAARMNGWKPIETAPKDGTTILAFEPGYGIGDGRGIIATVHWLNEDWSEPCWACPLDLGKVFDLPTHWMPLPKAPTPNDQEGKEG